MDKDFEKLAFWFSIGFVLLAVAVVVVSLVILWRIFA